MAAEYGYGRGGGDYVESIYNLIPKIEEKPPKPQMWVLRFDSIEAMVLSLVVMILSELLTETWFAKTFVCHRYRSNHTSTVKNEYKANKKGSKTMVRWKYFSWLWQTGIAFVFLRLYVANPILYRYLTCFLYFSRDHRKLPPTNLKTFWQNIQRNFSFQKVRP